MRSRTSVAVFCPLLELTYLPDFLDTNCYTPISVRHLSPFK